MVFSSHLFLFWFLPVALALYYGVPGRFRHLSLTVASYVFYGWANPLFCVLMLASTVVDYAAGLVIAGRDNLGEIALLPVAGPRSARQKLFLGLAIAANLGLLGYFKYANLAVETWQALFPLEAGSVAEEAWSIALPLGISFYTFQSMSYTIDVYRGDVRAVGNFVDFACFVSMFPQLVAGPIIRFREVADQLRERTHTLDKFARGIAFLSLGLTKKVLLANPCARIADLAFDNAPVGVAEAWAGLAAYSFQIYFDFSGYSDMAIGLGQMLGFMFPKNFDSPYQSASITEFWRRWHLSLSNWLRDYLYVPLGGNRCGSARTYFNLMIVMLLGGLWHGAAWNFLVWGGVHGGALAVERSLRNFGGIQLLPRPVKIAGTFVLVALAWVLFRADDLATAGQYYRSLFGLADLRPGVALLPGLVWQPYFLFALGAASLVTWCGVPTWDWTQRLPGWKAGCVLVLMAVSVAVLSMQDYNPFIYFIF